MKKKILTGLTAFALCCMTAIPAIAETVHYKGTPVSWDHGRTMAVYSFSDVQTGSYEHSATANTTSSGWEQPGQRAHAIQFVGTDTATAYWDCRE